MREWLLGRCDLLDVTAGERLGDKVRLVARVKLIAEVLDVPFDRAGRYAELLGTLLGGEAACDALENLAFSIRKSDEVFLLSRDVHHQPLFARAIFVITQ